MSKVLILLLAVTFFGSVNAKEINLEGDKVGFLWNGKNSKTVCLILPGGPQTKDMAENLESISEKFEKRGFSTARVFSKVGPLINNGPNKNLRYINDVMDKILKNYSEVENFIVCGFSNGGFGGIQAASKYSGKLKGVMAVPGLVTPDFKGGKQSVPIYLRIGENDRLGWGRVLGYSEKILKKYGYKVDAKVVKGAQHMFPLDWVEIDSWLKLNKITAKE